ncbi:MAG: hypothetical protein LBJ21_03020 [Acidobacteriota bacterium]|jgi:hypothetical protein|nr:hypothetical protein [Acidobacteriota bacterium]
MKEILIIRSVSFQQLDKNLPVIKDHYPDHKISVLTHEHGALLARKYKDVDEVYIYPYRDGFKYKNRAFGINDKKFAAVIIPVANITGAGFFNVLKFSLSIKAGKRAVCNVISDIREVEPAAVRLIGIKNGVISALSMVLTGVAVIPLIVFLPLRLFLLRKGADVQ